MLQRPIASCRIAAKTSQLFHFTALVVGLAIAAIGCGAETVGPTGSRGSSAGSTASSTTSPTGAAKGGAAATPLSSNPGNSGLLITPSGTAGSGSIARGGSAGATSCATGMQSTTPIIPTVWLVVDGSSSMDQAFDGARSRWDTLRSTLMDKGGVVDSLQAVVRFGMVIYAGGGDQANCVQLITAEPALNNLAKLSGQYPTTPVASGTPTDKALDYVVKNLPVLNTGTLDASAGPVYVVLATDGSPNDMCSGGLGGLGGQRGGGNAAVEQNVVDVTAQGTKNGMQMFVISLAGSDTRLQGHLNLVAAATSSKTPPYAPSTQNELITAFQKIVGGAGCLIKLDGQVAKGAECGGTVQLNSQALKCNDTNGWKLFDPRTVQLMGSACDQFIGAQSLVTANFPCDIFSPG
jgi:hypothetical protein